MAHLCSMQDQLRLESLLLRYLNYTVVVLMTISGFSSWGSLGFLTAWWLASKSKCPKRQEVEAVSFLRPGTQKLTKYHFQHILLVRQSTEYIFKGRRYRPHLSMGAVPKNLGTCFKVIIERYNHFDSVLRMRKLSTQQLKNLPKVTCLVSGQAVIYARQSDLFLTTVHLCNSCFTNLDSYLLQFFPWCNNYEIK